MRYNQVVAMTYPQIIKKTKEKIEGCLLEDRAYYTSILHLITNPNIKRKKVKTNIKSNIIALQKSLQYNIEKLETLKKEI